MKLVQLLAKELKEWPEGAGDVVGQARDGRLHLNGSYEENRGFTDEQYTLAKDWMSSDVTKSQWQAEREKMNKPKWIRHRGGKCPVPAGAKVSTRHRDGKVVDVHFHTATTNSGSATMNAIWKHTGDAHDIMSYKVISQPSSKAEARAPFGGDPVVEYAFGAPGEDMASLDWKPLGHGRISDIEFDDVTTEEADGKDTTIGTLTYKLEIDATEATQQIDSLVAKWGQIESPLKWRDEIIELEAYEEEFRREREKLIRKLESEGFNLIDHAPAKCLLDEWEAMDYESFCVGDTVVCIHEKSDDTIAELTIGKEYRLILDDEQICVIDDIGDPMRYCIEIGCFKLVKRA